MTIAVDLGRKATKQTNKHCNADGHSLVMKIHHPVCNHFQVIYISKQIEC